MRLFWLLSIASGGFIRDNAKVEDGTNWIRELPINFEWTNQQVAYLKWKYNIVIPGRARAMGSSFPGSHGFPVNLWPRSPSKPLTVVPVLVSKSFEPAVIEEVYDVLNRLTSQSDCVEFRWITHADLGDFANWISLKPGSDCRTTVGLPSIEDGFRGGEVTLELGNDCQKTPAVIRTMLLHAVGTSPATIGGRRVSTNEPTAFRLCSINGPYATCQGSSCKELGGKGWEILRSAVTVEEAKRRCKELFGMELATIQSPEEQRVVNFMLQTDDQGLERAKFWTGNNVIGKNLGQWRGNWASGFPQKHRNSAPVYMSYSASGWEWRNDINVNSKFPAICEASSTSKSSKCLNNLCSSQATCAEKGSAYSCRCNDGYFGNGFQCSPTSCPAGTVRHGETCVIDPCNSCKPRFACEAVNAGTHEAECTCKSGWTGNGQLCLPQQKSTTTKAALSPTTLPPFNRFAAEFLPSPGQSNRGASEGMKKSGAMADLTRRLEALKQEQLAVKFGPAPRKTTSTSAPTAAPSTVRQMPAFHNDAFQNKIQEKVLRKSSCLKAKTTASPSYVPSYPEISTPKQPQIDLDGLKREIAEFAKLAAEQSASQVETKVKFSQDEMQEEVDRVVELVKVFISQSEAERATLTAELERLQKYSSYFAERIDKISDEVSVVDKLSRADQEQFLSLSKTAENLKYKIDNVQRQFGSEVEKTKEKVEWVETQVVDTQIDLQEAKYQFGEQKERLADAEKKMKSVDMIGLRALANEQKVVNAQGQIRKMDDLLASVEHDVSSQRREIEQIESDSNSVSRQMKHLSHNMTVVNREMQNNEQELEHLATDLHQDTAELHNKDILLDMKLTNLEQVSDQVVENLEAVEEEVVESRAVLEAELSHAAQAAQEANAKASKSSTELHHFMNVQSRTGKGMTGRINRQNDLLGFLMNQVKKLQNKVNSQERKLKLLEGKKTKH